MKVTITENPPSFNLELDYTVEQTLKSFKEEVLNFLYDQHKKHNVGRLLLSDGMDSSFIALCLQELGISFKPLSFIFSKKQNYVTKEIIGFCKTNGFTPSFFLIEKEPFFKHVEYLTYEKKIAYPVLNGYYVDYILNETKENFFTGVSVEFKYYNNEYIQNDTTVYILKKNNPDRLFTILTSKTFLSYIKNPIFLKYYKTNRIDDEYFIRNLTYSSIFPSLKLKQKNRNWDDQIISNTFIKFYKSKHQKMFPWVFQLQSHKFYVDQYFEKD